MLIEIQIFPKKQLNRKYGWYIKFPPKTINISLLRKSLFHSDFKFSLTRMFLGEIVNIFLVLMYD